MFFLIIKTIYYVYLEIKHRFLDKYFSNFTLVVYFAVIVGSIFLTLFIFYDIILPLEDLVDLKEHTLVENHKLMLELKHLKESNQIQVSLLENFDETNKRLLIEVEEEHIKNGEDREKEKREDLYGNLSFASSLILYGIIVIWHLSS